MKHKMQSFNPATLEMIGDVNGTSPHQVEEIVQKSRNVFPLWKSAGLNERAAILRNAQQILLESKEDFAALITQEMGRPITESLILEVAGCIDIIGYYADNIHRFLDDRKVSLHHLLFRNRRNYTFFEPLGVLGIISPWNWPLLIPLGGIVPALISGNTVVFKHSELTPLLAVKMLELFMDAGVPEDVFQIVQGGADVGKALVDSSVEKIFFTGSTDVGKKVLEHASRSLKKCVLEMGGSDPAIVCEDADLDNTASGLLWGGFSNGGQNCNGVERIFVHESVADSLIDHLVDKMGKLYVGDPSQKETDIGPLASEAQLKKIEKIVSRTIRKGGKLLSGGKKVEQLSGYFYEPTLIKMDKYKPFPPDEEIFGPVMLITPVRDDNEAIELANRSSFGLSSSVWTGSAKRGYTIARQIGAGTVMINDVIISFGMTEAGWTGIKNSGIGWVHGEKGLDEMVNIKFITRDPQRHIQKMWWFPYNQAMFNAMLKGLDFLFSKRIWMRFKNVPAVLKHMAGYLIGNRKKADKL